MFYMDSISKKHLHIWQVSNIFKHFRLKLKIFPHTLNGFTMKTLRSVKAEHLKK